MSTTYSQDSYHAIHVAIFSTSRWLLRKSDGIWIPTAQSEDNVFVSLKAWKSFLQFWWLCSSQDQQADGSPPCGTANLRSLPLQPGRTALSHAKLLLCSDIVFYTHTYTHNAILIMQLSMPIPTLCLARATILGKSYSEQAFCWCIYLWQGWRKLQPDISRQLGASNLSGRPTGCQEMLQYRVEPVFTVQSRHLYTAVACHKHSASTITQKLSHPWFAIHAFMHTLQNSFLYMIPHAAMDVTYMLSSHSPGINIAHAYQCSLLIIMWQCMLMCFLCLRPHWLH